MTGGVWGAEREVDSGALEPELQSQSEVNKSWAVKPLKAIIYWHRLRAPTIKSTLLIAYNIHARLQINWAVS
jgi:hypothetical protein